MAEGGYSLSEFQSDRFDATKTASDQARQVALAGIAIVWLFSGAFFQGQSQEGPGAVVFVAGGLLALALALDLAQLVTRAWMMNSAYNRTEALPEVITARDAGDDPEVDDVGKAVEAQTKKLWVAKLISLALGYLAILVFFLGKIF